MGEIIGLPTAITYYPKHQNIHSSDERTEIEHTFFFLSLVVYCAAFTLTRAQ